MFRNKIYVLLAIITLGLTGGLVSQAQSADGPEYGVYQYVVKNASGTLDEITSAIETGVVDADGWQLLATVDAGVPEKCEYHARVFILYNAAHAAQILELNPRTGPFAVVERVNLFEDERGTHVSVVNPYSIVRTVLMDDPAYEKLAGERLEALRAVITTSVEGTVTDEQYGQLRNEGFIGKTMGVVAGGKFGDLIDEKASVQGGDLAAVAAGVQAGLGETGKKWGIHLVFEVELPGSDAVLLGVTGTPMDSKSFDIVKAGTDEDRSDFGCPGISHAAAYPLELLVVKDGDTVKVQWVEAMFRMKMYFEDAGKWAFMNNMKMPGSIDKEMKKQVKKGLESG